MNSQRIGGLLILVAALLLATHGMSGCPVGPVVPPVFASPISEPGLRVLVIYDSSGLNSLTPGQLSAYASNKVPAFVNAQGGKFARYDVSAIATIKDAWAKEGAARPRKSNQWVIVSNAPKGGDEVPLPNSDAEFLALVQKWVAK